MTAQKLIELITKKAQSGSGNPDIDLDTVDLVLLYVGEAELGIDVVKWDNEKQTVILGLEYI